MYEGNRESITDDERGVMSLDKIEDKLTPMQTKNEYREVADIFPALTKYKNEHNTTNLQKLCVEVAEFCRNIYASTQNEEERNIYKTVLLDKLIRK